MLEDILAGINPRVLDKMADDLESRANSIHGQPGADAWQRLYGCLSGYMRVASVRQT